MMDESTSTKMDLHKLGNTRGVPLAQLASFCFILSERGSLPANHLAKEAIGRGVVSLTKPFIEENGHKIPTRVLHHLIALQHLQLVYTKQKGANKLYILSEAGSYISSCISEGYVSEGPAPMDYGLRKGWRSVLLASTYLKNHWLRYFMPKDIGEYSIEAFVKFSRPVVIEKLHEGTEDIKWHLYGNPDSDLPFVDLDQIQDKEIYQGLRVWTNQAYLTDDRLPTDRETPFSFQAGNPENERFEVVSTPVSTWLNEDKDIELFRNQINQLLPNYGNRLAMPVLMLTLCQEYGYSKDNVKDLLLKIFSNYGNEYFFERGSKFLIKGAFGPHYKEEFTLSHYLSLDGIWRVGLVRYQL